MIYLPICCAKILQPKEMTITLSILGMSPNNTTLGRCGPSPIYIAPASERQKRRRSLTLIVLFLVSRRTADVVCLPRIQTAPFLVDRKRLLSRAPCNLEPERPECSSRRVVVSSAPQVEC